MHRLWLAFSVYLISAQCFGAGGSNCPAEIRFDRNNTPEFKQAAKSINAAREKCLAEGGMGSVRTPQSLTGVPPSVPAAAPQPAQVAVGAPAIPRPIPGDGVGADARGKLNMQETMKNPAVQQMLKAAGLSLPNGAKGSVGLTPENPPNFDE